jgi:HSP20 family molecular chaperone IbpA
MNDVIKQESRNGSNVAKAYQRRTVAPPVDVFENADELLIVADVPCVPNDGIELGVEDGTLTLSARNRTADSPQVPALAREYEEVDFVATYRIPAGIDTAAITAETKNGTLVVRLPKAAAAKARKIVVRSGTGD